MAPLFVSISTPPLAERAANRLHERSRRGLTTEAYAVVETNGLPFRLTLAECRTDNVLSADDMLESFGILSFGSPMEPATKRRCVPRSIPAAPLPTFAHSHTGS